MDFKKETADALSICIKEKYALEIPSGEIFSLMETPPDPKLGDIAIPCFKLSKLLRKAPAVIANDLSGLLKADFISRAQSVNAYLNIFFNPAVFARNVLTGALSSPPGKSDIGAGSTICIDYSSINIAKRFHIGHLSTTVIGNALRNIYTRLGYNVVSINHLGDWGTQFGKLLCAFRLWGDRDAVINDPMNQLEALYIKFHQEAAERPELEDEGRAWFARIEAGDPEAMELFNWFKEVTLEYAQKVYDKLGISFDSYAGESFYQDKMAPVVQALKDKNLLEESDGAQIVPLEQYNMPPCLIIKSDGTTLYATRDIAAAFYRRKEYNFSKLLYVVAVHQSLHFQQWFKVIELMGEDWAKDLVHVSYGMVSLEDGALSTRHGRIVYLEDFLDRAVVKASEIIQEKSPDLENKDTAVQQIGVGAVVWSALYNSRIKDTVFAWDRALNFDGETAPYAQYTHARCCSVLAKSAISSSHGWNPLAFSADALCDEESRSVLRVLNTFPGVINEAAQRYEPSLISRFVINLAQAYNKFYFEHRIIGSQPEQEHAWLAMTDAVRIYLADCLGLLGISAPRQM